MLFTVHKKLSVAHTGDFNHTNYNYIEITSLYHPSTSISKKKQKRKEKRNPYLPYLFFSGMSQETDILFGHNTFQ